MTKEEALSMFLNIDVNDVDFNMEDQYIDIDNGIKYEVYTQQEVIDKATNIILKSLYKYPAEYIAQFVNIPNYQYDSYSFENNKASIIKILNNTSISDIDKNRLILTLINSIDAFVNHNIQREEKGFGVLFGALNGMEYSKGGYLIYSFKE